MFAGAHIMSCIELNVLKGRDGWTKTSWGYYPRGGLRFVVLILLILLLMGRI